MPLYLALKMRQDCGQDSQARTDAIDHLIRNFPVSRQRGTKTKASQNGGTSRGASRNRRLSLGSLIVVVLLGTVLAALLKIRRNSESGNGDQTENPWLGVRPADTALSAPPKGTLTFCKDIAPLI